ncbi:MAG: hypothetical protein V9G16_03430 [Nitrosomonas sp.]
MKYDLIESMRQSHSIALMCQVLDVSEMVRLIALYKFSVNTLQF